VEGLPLGVGSRGYLLPLNERDIDMFWNLGEGFALGDDCMGYLMALGSKRTSICVVTIVMKVSLVMSWRRYLRVIWGDGVCPGVLRDRVLGGMG
jgi:hypothetical protein